MKKERRNDKRANLGRRSSERIAEYRPVWWREEGVEDPRVAWLVEESAHGLAIVTESQDTPRLGTRIMPHEHLKRRPRHRPAVVTRTDRLSDLLDLTAAEYIDGIATSDQPEGNVV